MSRLGNLIGPDLKDLAVFFDSPSTYKMHDLVSIPGLHGGCDPLRPRKDLQVALNGYPVGGEAQVGKQGRNA
jgi:hypothetical protein